MKKVVLASLLSLSLASAAHAFDWGLNINEVPIATLGETTLYLEALKSRLWITQPVFGADLRVEGEAAYSTSSDSLTSWKNAGTLTFDLVEASLRGTTAMGAGAVVEWDLGRRAVTDLTGGWIISSRWDGVAGSWFQGQTRLNGSLGYSGLLLKKTSKVEGSPADTADIANSKVVFAPQRVYALTGVSFNEAFLRQDFQIEVLGDYDFRSGNNAVHGAYSTLSLTGPLPLGWRQKVYATGAFRLSPSKWAAAYLSGGEWSATLPFLGSRLVVNGVVSQGFRGFGFQPISGKGLAEVISLDSANSASGGADFSFKPLSKTTLGIKANALFRTSHDPLAISGFKDSSSAYWLGAEAGLYGSWTPTSDLTFGFSNGLFLPNSGAFVSGTKPTVLAVVTMTLKL